MKTIELFKVRGKAGYFSKQAVEQSAKQGFLRLVENWQSSERNGDYYKISRVISRSKPYKIFDNLEKTEFHFIYTYGDTKYFDTEEERTIYKRNLHLQAVKNQIKATQKEIEEATAKLEALQKELKALEKF